MATKETSRKSRTKGRSGEARVVAQTTTTSQEPKTAPQTASPTAKTPGPIRSRGRPRVSNSDTDRVTLRLEKDHLEVIDMLVRLKQFSNRSDAIRQAIKQFCDEALEEVEEMVKKAEKRSKLRQLTAMVDRLDEYRQT